jgi:hypothetical protein
MTCHLSPPSLEPAALDVILIDVVRAWRRARDGDHPVQPSLFRALDSRDCGLLAPVFDSLLRLYETALGRRLCVGEGPWMSEDELLLLGLLDGSKARPGCLDCAESAAARFDCALCSTRIMTALTMGPPMDRPGLDHRVARPPT